MLAYIIEEGQHYAEYPGLGQWFPYYDDLDGDQVETFPTLRDLYTWLKERDEPWLIDDEV